MNTLFFTLALILFFPGLIGIIIPILPGIPYMFIIALVYGFVTKFETLKTAEIIILAIPALASLVVDYSTGLIGAKYAGASKKSIIAGLIGLLIGTIVLPPFGGILGLFVAVMLAELQSHKDEKRAIKAATGSLIGSLTGIIISLVLAIIFVVLFVIFAQN